MTIIPLTPSTGGILQPNQVIGRDAEVEKFKHFYERITLHYPNQEDSLLILKFLCKEENPKTETEILNYLSSEKEISRTTLINELDRLRTDDYLLRQIKEEQRVYQFKYEILRKWWKINKSY